MSRTQDPVPYCNYRHVARSFGDTFADRLAIYDETAREAKIMAACILIERKWQRAIGFNIKNGIIDHVGEPRLRQPISTLACLVLSENP